MEDEILKMVSRERRCEFTLSDVSLAKRIASVKSKKNRALYLLIFRTELENILMREAINGKWNYRCQAAANY